MGDCEKAETGYFLQPFAGTRSCSRADVSRAGKCPLKHEQNTAASPKLSVWRKQTAAVCAQPDIIRPQTCFGTFTSREAFVTASSPQTERTQCAAPSAAQSVLWHVIRNCSLPVLPAVQSPMLTIRIHHQKYLRLNYWLNLLIRGSRLRAT